MCAQVSAEEIKAIRATGEAPISSTEVAQPLNGLVDWRTDGHVLPPSSLPCFLWALLVALAMPSLQTLLHGRDEMTALMGDIEFQWFQGLAERHPGAPVGACVLERVTCMQWDVLLKEAGVYIMLCSMRKSCLTVVKHYMTYNAGTRVLYLGPWVWVLSTEDLADVSEVAHQVELRHGIFMNEGSLCRQVRVNPHHQSVHLLPYNTPSDLASVGMSASARKRANKRQRDEAFSRA